MSLGINPNFSTESAEMTEEKEASQSAEISVPKIIILNTPTGFLRVREEPTISSLEIGRVKPQEEYELIEEGDGWFKIKVIPPAGGDIVGWVSSQYSKKK